MGFKTTNYQLKGRNTVLPQAYAVIRKTVTDGEKGYAIIGIDETRELASNPLVKPLEQVRVDFDVNRNQNDRVTAYLAAVADIEKEKINDETHKLEKVIVKGLFADWEVDKIYY
jgi:hypothetical protein